jgi:hypothetical protein
MNGSGPRTAAKGHGVVRVRRGHVVASSVWCGHAHGTATHLRTGCWYPG